MGFVLLNNETPLPSPFPPKAAASFHPLGPWAKFFEPKNSKNIPHCLFPNDWVKFFVALLLSPSHFECAKGILQSGALLSCLNEDSGPELSLCSKCPVTKAPFCSLFELEPDVSEVDLSDAPTLDEDTDNGKSKDGTKK